MSSPPRASTGHAPCFQRKSAKPAQMVVIAIMSKAKPRRPSERCGRSVAEKIVSSKLAAVIAVKYTLVRPRKRRPHAMSDLSGRCSCGDVVFRLTSPPMFVHCCHCLDCQRQTGSAFVLNALIEADRV